MNEKTGLNMPLLSPGMMALLAAQFLSAMADNAILIVAIASFKLAGVHNMEAPLQDAFILPFILLAPFAGPVADGFSKGRVMLAANLAKLGGALAMAAGANEIAAYCLVGIGAMLYSPAKYGILTQMFGSAALVRANSLIESSTIAAILIGVLLGGWLADYSLPWAYAGVMIAYALAAVANLFIPRLPAESPGGRFHPWLLIKAFSASVVQLFRNRDARFSLLGTSIFWGSGITLRSMLFAWVPAALLILDNRTPANLMGAVSIGIVLGAGVAGLWISLANVNRALIGGLLLGPVVLGLAFMHSLTPAAMLMVAIGACGGLFVVPLNALLQERGHKTIGAGNALAVQNFSENSSMLLLVSLYGAARAMNVPITTISAGFGVLLLTLIGTLAFFRLRRT